MPADDIYSPRVARRPGNLRVRGVDYALSEWGHADDPLLVYLHGWGDTGSCFQFVVDELQDGFRVLAPDWRGFGESASTARSFWFPDYLADLHDLLGVFSPGRPVRLVGHSMGANVGGLYAGIFPERVCAFVNVEGFGLPDSDPGNAPAHYRKWIEKSGAAGPFREYESFGELAERIMRASPRLGAARAMFVAQQWARQSDDGSIRIKADPAHKLPNAVQYRRAEAMACWKQVKAPVLLVAGGDSRFSAGARSWKDSQRCYRSVASVSIADAGHMLHFEQPADLAATIGNFLRDL